MSSNSGGPGPSGVSAPTDARNEGDTTSSVTSGKLKGIVQFCQLFGEALKIKPLSADDLGRALQQPADSTPIISDLVFKLLSPVGADEKGAEAWQELLQHKLSSSLSLGFATNPLEGKDFNSVSPQTREDVLYALCEWRLIDTVVQHTIKATAEAVDVPPGAPGSGSPEGASLLEGLRHYVARLSNSQGSYEKSMHDFLVTRVLAKVGGAAPPKQEAGSGAAAPAEENPANHVQAEQAANPEAENAEEASGGEKSPEGETAVEAAPAANNPGREASPAAAPNPPPAEPAGQGPGVQEPSPQQQASPGEGAGAAGGAQTGEAPAATAQAPPAPAAAPEGVPAPAAAPAAQLAQPVPKVEPKLEPPAAQPPPGALPPHHQAALAMQHQLMMRQQAALAALQQQQQAAAQQAAAQQVPKQEPASEEAAPSAGRPVRSSRQTAPRKYQDGEPGFEEEEEEEGDEPPPPKRPKQEHPAALAAAAAGAGAAGPPVRHPPGHAMHRPMHTGMPGAFPPRIARPPAAPAAPPPPLYRALYPSALELPVPRRRRSGKRRTPRSTRASMNRLKQAAHGTLPLGIKREARASVYVLAAGGSPEASASESEDLGEEEEDDESSSDFSDSELEDERPRGKGRGRGRPSVSGRQQQEQRQQAPGSMQQQQQRPAYPQGQMQITPAQHAQLQAILAQTPAHMRPAIMQRFVQQVQAQQQLAQQQQQQAQQQAAAAQAQARAGGAVPHFSQLPHEQQRAIAEQFLNQLPTQQQMAVRQLSQDQLVNLLQNYWQQRVGGAAGQQAQQQGQMGGAGPAGVPQQHYGGGGMGGPPPGTGDQRLVQLMNQLAPEVRAQLQTMPVDHQRTVLQQLLQRQQLQEQQQRMMMAQQAAAAGGMMGGMGGQPGPGGVMQGGPRPAGQPQQGQAGARPNGEEKVDVNWFLNDS